jgi:hypothetical protein
MLAALLCVLLLNSLNPSASCFADSLRKGGFARVSSAAPLAPADEDCCLSCLCCHFTAVVSPIGGAASQRATGEFAKGNRADPVLSVIGSAIDQPPRVRNRAATAQAFGRHSYISSSP